LFRLKPYNIKFLSEKRLRIVGFFFEEYGEVTKVRDVQCCPKEWAIYALKCDHEKRKGKFEDEKASQIEFINYFDR
ncbi:Uncharacterized protein BM_BM13157, partial [Brugia malayi]